MCLNKFSILILHWQQTLLPLSFIYWFTVKRSEISTARPIICLHLLSKMWSVTYSDGSSHWPLCDLSFILEIFPWFPTVWFRNSVLSAVCHRCFCLHLILLLSWPGFLSVCRKAKKFIISLLFLVSLSGSSHSLAQLQNFFKLGVWLLS